MSTVWLWSSASWRAAPGWWSPSRPRVRVARVTSCVCNDSPERRRGTRASSAPGALHSRSMLRTVTATRYVTPLREGGSLPALVEADDDGLYVVKLLGRGPGPQGAGRGAAGGRDRAASRAARAGPGAGRARRRARQGRADARDPGPARCGRRGTNIGLDFLPGALPFVAGVPAAALDPDLAAAIVWFDACTTNVDRTPRNPNLIVWHRRLYLIDHGSALYIHHTWRDPAEHARRPFAPIRDHVLLPFAWSIADADARLAPHGHRGAGRGPRRRDPRRLAAGRGRHCRIPTRHRRAYVDYLLARLEAPRAFVEEADRARRRVSRSSTRSCAWCRASSAARRSTPGSC